MQKKKNLIGLALFGCLDQMLRTAVQGGLHQGFALPAPAKNGLKGDLDTFKKSLLIFDKHLKLKVTFQFGIEIVKTTEGMPPQFF